MIDHVYISVTDIDRSLAFYSEALKALGWSAFGNYDSASGPKGVPTLYGIGDDVFGSGKAVGSSIWPRQRKLGETGLYLGIVCDTSELLDAARQIRTENEVEPHRVLEHRAAAIVEVRRRVLDAAQRECLHDAFGAPGVKRSTRRSWDAGTS